MDVSIQHTGEENAEDKMEPIKITVFLKNSDFFVENDIIFTIIEKKGGMYESFNY